MDAYKFFSQVEEGDIVVLRKDLEVGKRYGSFTYLDTMPKPGESLEYDLRVSTGGFVVVGSKFRLSPEMVDYIVDLDLEKEEVTPEKVEELTRELKETRERLESLQKEFDRVKCLLEEISKDK